MEENTIPSGADDKTKPQEIETQQAGDQESSEQVESKENEVQESASEQIPDKVDEPIEVEAVEKRNEISKEINISELSIDALVDLLSNVTTRDDWFKNHKQIQSINSVFEEKFQADLEINKQSFIKEGGNEIDFYFKPEYKKKFDQIGYDYREKRRNHYKSQEATQKVNLEKKKAIIEEIKNLINIEQNINTIYNSFRALQESWYNTGPIPRADNQNIWETYKHHVERFYDFLHLNRELRDLDFKHNYEEKLKIIEQAEALQQVPDIVRASRDLNTLHQLWKNDLGPVAKEHSEDLWNRFQEASRVIQSKRQTYQKDMVGAMKENLEKKETLL
ncbi:DUF349 domain-containing protein, partial [Flavobacteriaceae bacterium]|nr:DUF349 domain-containing protein [Flavobacteriaceae bacterium]